MRKRIAVSSESLLVLRALSHKIRLRTVLVMTYTRMVSARALAEVMGVSLRTMRTHLALLERAGLVVRIPCGSGVDVYALPDKTKPGSAARETLTRVINWQKWNPLMRRDHFKLMHTAMQRFRKSR